MTSLTNETAADVSLLGAIEPKTFDAFAERADAIAHGDKISDVAKAALAIGTVPLVLAALASEAPAQTTSAVADVLQFALLLENLESEFYKAVLGTSSVAGFNSAFAPVRAKLSANAVATLQLLSAHEIKHVALLQSALGGAATIYNPATTFDFTGSRTVGGSASGPFYQATQDVTFLLAGTQGFEDTGVRAYKGQAGVLLGQAVLTTALQIHALEARHAARIRRLRRSLDTTNTALRYSGTVKGDGAAAAGAPTGATLPAAVVAAFAAIYAGEGNTQQTVNNGSTNVTLDVSTLPNLQAGTDVTQGFDEPLGANAVGAIVQTFIIPTVTLPAGVAK